MANINAQIEYELRLCKVKDEVGYFHTWEHYSVPLEASPLKGGAPAGVYSKVYGIIEFSDGVRFIEPTEIHFCDDMNNKLKKMEGESENE